MKHPEDIFNPRHYERVRLPQLEAETLPPWCYTSQAFYEREVERIFMRHWVFIGRSDCSWRLGGIAAVGTRSDGSGRVEDSPELRHL